VTKELTVLCICWTGVKRDTRIVIMYKLLSQSRREEKRRGRRAAYLVDGAEAAAEDARSEGVAESVREGLEDLVDDDTVEGLEARDIGRVDGAAWMSERAES
jgi:hypothetical protein